MDFAAPRISERLATLRVRKIAPALLPVHLTLFCIPQGRRRKHLQDALRGAPEILPSIDYPGRDHKSALLARSNVRLADRICRRLLPLNRRCECEAQRNVIGNKRERQSHSCRTSGNAKAATKSRSPKLSRRLFAGVIGRASEWT